TPDSPTTMPLSRRRSSMCTRGELPARAPFGQQLTLRPGRGTVNCPGAGAVGLGEHVANAVGQRAPRRPADRVAEQVVWDPGGAIGAAGDGQLRRLVHDEAGLGGDHLDDLAEWARRTA